MKIYILEKLLKEKIYLLIKEKKKFNQFHRRRNIAKFYKNLNLHCIIDLRMVIRSSIWCAGRGLTIKSEKITS
jgi:hypothetical protein